MFNLKCGMSVREGSGEETGIAVECQGHLRDLDSHRGGLIIGGLLWVEPGPSEFRPDAIKVGFTRI
jgi:hypothetical protein